MASLVAKVGATGAKAGAKSGAKMAAKQAGKQAAKTAAKKGAKQAAKKGAKSAAKKGAKSAAKKGAKSAAKKGAKKGVKKAGKKSAKKVAKKSGKKLTKKIDKKGKSKLSKSVKKSLKKMDKADKKESKDIEKQTKQSNKTTEKRRKVLQPDSKKPVKSRGAKGEGKIRTRPVGCMGRFMSFFKKRKQSPVRAKQDDESDADIVKPGHLAVLKAGVSDDSQSEASTTESVSRPTSAYTSTAITSTALDTTTTAATTSAYTDVTTTTSTTSGSSVTSSLPDSSGDVTRPTTPSSILDTTSMTSTAISPAMSPEPSKPLAYPSAFGGDRHPPLGTTKDFGGKQPREEIRTIGPDFSCLTKLDQLVKAKVITEQAIDATNDREFNLLLFRIAKHVMLEECEKKRVNESAERDRRQDESDWLKALKMALKVDRQQRAARKRCRCCCEPESCDRTNCRYLAEPDDDYAKCFAESCYLDGLCDDFDDSSDEDDDAVTELDELINKAVKSSGGRQKKYKHTRKSNRSDEAACQHEIRSDMNLETLANLPIESDSEPDTRHSRVNDILRILNSKLDY